MFSAVLITLSGVAIEIERRQLAAGVEPPFRPVRWRFLATGTMTCATRPIVTPPVRSQPQGVLGLSEKRIHLPMKPKSVDLF